MGEGEEDVSISDYRVSTENVTDDEWMRKVQSLSELSVWVLLLYYYYYYYYLLSLCQFCHLSYLVVVILTNFILFLFRDELKIVSSTPPSTYIL
jgi:hypothetical protein